MKAVLEPCHGVGEFAQSLRFYFAGYRRSVTVSLTGRYVAPFPRSIDLGTFSDRTVREIVMHDVAKQAGLRIAWARCSDERIDIEASEDRLRVVAAAREIGEWIDTFIDVFFEGDAASPPHRIWLHGVASGGLVVDPEELAFGLVPTSKGTVTKLLRVRAVDGHPLGQLQTAFDDELLSVRLVARDVREARYAVTVLTARRQLLDTWLTLAAPDGSRGIKVRCFATIE
ncbi:MAG: hypothetical protein D6788_02800 [Planctomycetota bacterium]|nr:MAG: hypothetical protein D6788_02800 [Planctomycetota bacterium]